MPLRRERRVIQIRSWHRPAVGRCQIPYEFGGTIDLVLAPEGVRCRVELPADWLSSDSGSSDAI